MKTTHLFALCLAAFATTAACATDPAAESVSSTDAELRVPRGPEIVGDITYGETKSVSYTEVPTYRAFRLAGKTDDVVDLWVRSTTGGDARAWVLRQDGKNLAKNDDADVTTSDAHIVVTLPRTETYYLVLRDANDEDNDFEVTLAGGGGGGVAVPPNRIGTTATVRAECNFFIEWSEFKSATSTCPQYGGGWIEEVDLDVAIGGTSAAPKLTMRAFSKERVLSTWGAKKTIGWPETTLDLDPATGRVTSTRHFNTPPSSYGGYCNGMTKGPRTFQASVTGDKLTFDMFESLQTNTCCDANERRAQCKATLPPIP